MSCGCSMTSGMWGWAMGPLAFVMMLALWALLIWGGIVLVRHLTGRAGSSERELARRFAAGDIDEDEYRARREVLRTTSGGRSVWSGGFAQ